MRNLQADPLAKSLYMRQIRHNLERTMDLPLSESDPKAGNRVHEMKEPLVQGGPASSSFVEGWRSPRTITTLSFVDGTMGRAYLTFREGGISNAVRDQVNRKYEKYMFIADPQPTSHIWTESSLILYLDFLAQEIRLRRAQLNLSAEARALVLVDQAGAHMSKSFIKLQRKWSIANNIVSRLVLSVYILFTFSYQFQPTSLMVWFAFINELLSVRVHQRIRAPR